MQGKLPEQVDPKRLAQHAARLVGEVPAAALKRLGTVFEIRGDAQVELRFARSASGRPQISGQITVPVASTCQRCLQTYATTLRAEVVLEIGEKPRDAEQDYDLVLRADERVGLPELIEDELLLAAPMIALHPRGECAVPDASEVPRPERDEPPRGPFAELGKLWGRDKE